MLRIGFLGAGFIARYHALQLLLAPTPCEVVTVHDPDPAKVATFLDELSTNLTGLGNPESVGSVDEVLDQVDAVFVCTWTATHREVVARAVSSGVPVFCEKPLGVDLDDATAVAGLLGRAPLHMVGLVLRSTPAMVGLRELIRDPSAGRVMNVVFRDDQFLPVGGMYGSQWRSDRALAGSGALLEHSIHDVDILEWLIGPMEDVSARISCFHGIEGIEDSVSAIGSLTDGASFTLTSVWHDVGARPSQRRIEVFCENRLVTLGGDVFGPVSVHADEASLELEGDALVEWLNGRGVALRSAEQEFLDAVTLHLVGGSVPELHPDASDALRAHVVVDALYRSAASGGSPVHLPHGTSAPVLEATVSDAARSDGAR